MAKNGLRIPQISPAASVFQLRVGRSRIQGFGVFAEEKIPAGRKVIEYTGRRISMIALRRMRAGKRPKKEKRICMFICDRYWAVDGSDGGNGAELINHGCDPNLRTRKLRGHVLYYSHKKIRVGEELTVDYRLSPLAFRYPCQCGSPKCRGTMNLPASPEKNSARAEKRVKRRAR